MKNRKSNRLHGFNYASDNLYFVTICVNHRICYFGEIRSQQMILNPFGEIAQKQWNWLGEHFPYVTLHSFVVMPNHVHGIVEINRRFITTIGTGRDIVGTGRDLSLQYRDLSLRNQKIKSLSELIGAYKTTVSKMIHLKGGTCFAWQRSFFDHIIHDRESFDIITNYILKNPLKWNRDQFREK